MIYGSAKNNEERVEELRGAEGPTRLRNHTKYRASTPSKKPGDLSDRLGARVGGARTQNGKGGAVRSPQRNNGAMTMIKEKAKACQLCGEIDASVDMYIGGYVQYAHPECAKVGDKAIHQYLLSLHHRMFGIEVFVRDMLKVIEKEKEAHNGEQ